jgi:hypothetical protein
MNQIMPRSTVETIVAQRDRTLRLYDEAFAALAASQEATVRAGSALLGLIGEQTGGIGLPLMRRLDLVPQIPADRLAV